MLFDSIFCFNLLAAGIYASKFKTITQNSNLGMCCEIALKRKPQNLTVDESTLFQVMAWCC